MKKFKHEAELLKAALLAGVWYAHQLPEGHPLLD